MSHHRFAVGTGVLVALAGAALVATADPDNSNTGSYVLTGTEGGKADSVKLVVGADGSVSRAVTFQDGRTENLSGRGSFSPDGKTLRVTFQADGSDGGSDGTTKDPSDLSGTWQLSGRNGVGAYTGSGTFTKGPDGWKGLFSYDYTNGQGSGAAMLTGTLSGSTFSGHRIRTTGIAGAISRDPGVKPYPITYALGQDGLSLGGNYGPGGAFSESFTRASLDGSTASSSGVVTAAYTFDGTGNVSGALRNTAPGASWKTAAESGKRDDAGGLAIVSPANGTGVLVGQVVDVVVTPKTADFEVVSGAARRTAAGKLQVTGEGDVVLAATLKGAKSNPVTVKAVKLEVVALEVQNGQPISDATLPHMKRELGSDKKPAVQPAAILLGEKLVVKATLKAAADLAAPAKVTLVASGGGVKLTGTGTISSLKAGDTLTLSSDRALSSVIRVNKLALDFVLDSDSGSTTLASALPLRVYTMFKPSIRNGPYLGEQQRDIPTKDHLEKVCTWADGASQNVGDGDSSICWKLDNMVRHHVHPVDFKQIPFTCAYPFDSRTPPMNYGDLPEAATTRSTGERPVSQLYYPPLDNEIKNPAKEGYEHFQSNFGWWVLDNPTHTGGRCNQQASLMCDLFGTMGIKAKIHYLHRVGVSRSGRPVTQYFNSFPNEMYWNFHGLAEAILADGTPYVYDGSFSFAPERKHGTVPWAEAVGKWFNKEEPFIWEFGPWYYDDGGLVQDNDIPTRHVDGDNPNAGEFSGVPLAPHETLNWYNHAKKNKDGSAKENALGSSTGN